MWHGTKTVQAIKLVVRAPEQSYPERGMGGRKAIAGGELCVFALLVPAIFNQYGFIFYHQRKSD